MSKQLLFTLSLCLWVVYSNSVSAHVHWRKTSNFQERTFFQQTLNTLDSSHRDIDAMLVDSSGHWLVASGDNVYNSAGFPFWMALVVSNQLSLGNKVVAGDCSTNSCTIVFENWSHTAYGAPPRGFTEALDSFKRKGWKVRDLELTPSGYVLLGPGNVASYKGIDKDLGQAIYDRRIAKRQIEDLEIDFNGGWALMADHNAMYENVHSTIAARLDAISQGSYRLDRLLIGIGDNYVAYSGTSATSNSGTALDAVEYNLGKSGDTNIWARMEELGITGVSLAVIEPDGSSPKVVASRGYGRKHAEKDLPVLGNTPFDLASLSKYLGAIATLRYFESQNYLEGIDDNAVDSWIPPSMATLYDWEAIGSSFTDAPDYGMPGGSLGVGISIRRLLSHTAGIVKKSSTLVESNKWNDAEQQTTLDWLLGMQCPSNSTCDYLGSKWVWQDSQVGGQYQYSSGAFLIVQAYLEDITGIDIYTYLKDEVFNTIGMVDTAAEIKLPLSFTNRTVWQHNSSGPKSRLAQSTWPLGGGVWASAKDYAEAMIITLNEGRNSKGQVVLEAESIKEILSTVPLIGGGTSTYGLGVNLDSTVTESNNQDFFHSGSHPGRAYSYMCGLPSQDEGIVILINTEYDTDDSEDVRGFVAEIRSAYTSAAGWPSFATCN